MPIPQIIAAPIAQFVRRRSFPKSPSSTGSWQIITPIKLALTAGVQRLDLSRDPREVWTRVRSWKATPARLAQLGIVLAVWIYAIWIMTTPTFLWSLLIPAVFILACSFPITNQLIWPAAPIFTWVLLFFSARYIPTDSRPAIHVALLPALESVLYGANISDLQTRLTHPLLDVLAWLPYGVLHFALPFVVAVLLWLFGPKGSVQYWGKAFGFMNLFGVITQIVLPCAAPCKCVPAMKF